MSSSLATMTSTWPFDNVPSAKAAEHNGNLCSREANDTRFRAAAEVIDARSRSHAVMDVAPSASHRRASS